jgi:hypothetical protein
MIDRSSDLAVLAALAQEEEQQVLAARRMLATGQSRCLSELPVLSERELDLLLDLVGEALMNDEDPLHNLRASSEDGTLFISLSPPPPCRPTAVLEAKSGTLQGPNYVTVISEADAKPEMTPKRQVTLAQR